MQGLRAAAEKHLRQEARVIFSLLSGTWQTLSRPSLELVVENSASSSHTDEMPIDIQFADGIQEAVRMFLEDPGESE